MESTASFDLERKGNLKNGDWQNKAEKDKTRERGQNGRKIKWKLVF